MSRDSDSGWMKDFNAAVADVKAYEAASRPPPPVPKIFDTKAQFKGIITLANPQDAARLANEIQTFIHSAVSVFDEIDSKPSAKQDFLNNIHNMASLLDTFPRICIDDTDRDAAQRNINSLHESRREVEAILQAHTKGGLLKTDAGKKLAHELKNMLERIMAVAKVMENFQRKLLLLACRKATDVVVLMRNTRYNNQWDEKQRLYHVHLDNLQDLCRTRMDILEQQPDGNQWKQKIHVAVEEIKRQRGPLLERTNQLIRTPTDASNDSEQKRIADTMNRSVQQIADAVEQSMQGAHGKFDHSIAIRENLDLLQNAAKNRDGAEVAKAAQAIANELDKMKPPASPVPDDPDDDSGRRALEDALRRLRDKLKDLLGASRKVVTDPTPSNVFGLEQLADDFGNKARELDQKQTFPPGAALPKAQKEARELLDQVPDARRRADQLASIHAVNPATLRDVDQARKDVEKAAGRLKDALDSNNPNAIQELLDAIERLKRALEKLGKFPEKPDRTLPDALAEARDLQDNTVPEINRLAEKLARIHAHDPPKLKEVEQLHSDFNQEAARLGPAIQAAENPNALKELLDAIERVKRAADKLRNFPGADLPDLDTISATLPQSGMIEAAAQAANILAQLFQ